VSNRKVALFSGLNRKFSLLYTHYSIFYSPSSPFSLSPTLSLPATACYSVYHASLAYAVCSGGRPGRYASARVAGARYATTSVPAVLPGSGADSLIKRSRISPSSATTVRAWQEIEKAHDIMRKCSSHNHRACNVRARSACSTSTPLSLYIFNKTNKQFHSPT